VHVAMKAGSTSRVPQLGGRECGSVSDVLSANTISVKTDIQRFSKKTELSNYRININHQNPKHLQAKLRPIIQLQPEPDKHLRRLQDK